MKRFFEESEVLLCSKEQTENFLKEVCDTDVWKRAYASETTAIGLDNNPICMDSMRTDRQIPAEVSDDSVRECMESVKLLLSIPCETRFCGFPLGTTALSSLVQRAGYGTSSVLLTCEDKANQIEMAPDVKAEVLTAGLRCFKNSVLVLIRDEKIRAVLSGDESDYSPIRADEIFAETINGLEKQFDEVEFLEGTASHELFTFNFKLKDEYIERAICDVFRNAGIAVGDDFKLSIRVVTSDIGTSGVNITPMLYDVTNRVERVIGKTLSLTHKNKHSISDYAVNVQKVYSMFKDAELSIEKMKDAKVKHTKGCYLRVCKQAGFPKKLAVEDGEKFEAQFGNRCSQIDVYWRLFELLDTYNLKTSVSASRKIQLEEGICRIAFSNMADYDLPFEWE